MARSRSKMPAPPNQAALEADNPEMVQPPVMDLDGQPELDVADEAEPVEAVKPPPPPSRKKIKVVATRAGFFRSERKVAGNRFEVFEHQLGSWMDCEDPLEQKKHKARLEARHKKVNKAAVLEHEEELADE